MTPQGPVVWGRPNNRPFSTNESLDESAVTNRRVGIPAQAAIQGCIWAPACAGIMLPLIETVLVSCWLQRHTLVELAQR